MPDTLNKQAIINLLIDSPLREPIKINLIDIVNNTNEPDLPKVYSTITKELEIFQKATERRMKLADETIAKLSGTPVADPANPTTTISAPVAPLSPEPSLPDFSMPTPPAPVTAPVMPPLDLPPMPTEPTLPPMPTMPSMPQLSVPPLDLPPLPSMPQVPEMDTPVEAMPAAPVIPAFQPLGSTQMTSTSDEDALAEIQKELDSLKSATAADISAAATPVQQ